MTNADRSRFGEGMAALGVVYNTEVEDVRFAAYFSGLEDIPIEHVVAAMRAAMKCAEFFPKIAELRSLADKAREAEVATFRLIGSSAEDREVYEREGIRGFHACAHCEDSGFTLKQVCTSSNRCGNRICEMGGYPEHFFTTPCLCRQTNPAIRQKVQTMRRYRKELP